MVGYAAPLRLMSGHSISRCKVNKILTRDNLFHTFYYRNLYATKKIVILRHSYVTMFLT